MHFLAVNPWIHKKKIFMGKLSQGELSGVELFVGWIAPWWIVPGRFVRSRSECSIEYFTIATQVMMVIHHAIQVIWTICLLFLRWFASLVYLTTASLVLLSIASLILLSISRGAALHWSKYFLRVPGGQEAPGIFPGNLSACKATNIAGYIYLYIRIYLINTRNSQVMHHTSWCMRKKVIHILSFNERQPFPLPSTYFITGCKNWKSNS